MASGVPPGYPPAPASLSPPGASPATPRFPGPPPEPQTPPLSRGSSAAQMQAPSPSPADRSLAAGAGTFGSSLPGAPAHSSSGRRGASPPGYPVFPASLARGALSVPQPPPAVEQLGRGPLGSASPPLQGASAAASPVVTQHDVALATVYEPLGLAFRPGTLHVVGVAPSGAAARAGVLPGGVLERVDEQAVWSEADVQDALQHVRVAKRAGEFRVAVRHPVPPVERGAGSPPSRCLEASLQRARPPQWRHRDDHGVYDGPPATAAAADDPRAAVAALMQRRRDGALPAGPEEPMVDVLVPDGTDAARLTAAGEAVWRLLVEEAEARTGVVRWYRGFLGGLERACPAPLRGTAAACYRHFLHAPQQGLTHGPYWRPRRLPASKAQAFMKDGRATAGDAASPARAASASPPGGRPIDWINPRLPRRSDAPRVARRCGGAAPPWAEDAMRACLVFAGGGVRCRIDYTALRGWRGA
eukprot:TRINITY_DN7358_c0_g1_i1.p1 TRINITY_DN7358_c0_g1~~TRINITY_DN7358_c0_g1_i1.p1  ORF type:complete len:473 (+),score=115.86 TRINITY_DN7358_c0_g1_i1:209-1627(+)